MIDILPGPTARLSGLLSLFLVWGAPSAVAAASQEPVALEPGPGEHLGLGEAVRDALVSYPSIASAAHQVDAARAGLGEARSAWWPRIDLSAHANHFQLPILARPIHELNPNTFEFDRNIWGGDAFLKFVVLDGSRAARIRGARAQLAQSEWGRTEAELQLIASVTTGYLQVLSLRDILAAQDSELVALRAELRRVEQQLAQGGAAEVERYRAQAAVDAALARRVTLAAQLDTGTRALARMIGRPEESLTPSQLVPVSLGPWVAELPLDSVVSRALASNPVVAQARQAALVAQAVRTDARAEWIPSVDVRAGYQAFGGANDLTAEWQVGVGVTYPLFTGGARSSRIARASARWEAAGDQVRLAELQTAESADQATALVATSGSRMESLGSAVSHLEEVARIERLALETGEGAQTDYLKAQADLLEARAGLAEARHALVAAYVGLARVTGELTLEWLERAVEEAS